MISTTEKKWLDKLEKANAKVVVVFDEMVAKDYDSAIRLKVLISTCELQRAITEIVLRY